MPVSDPVPDPTERRAAIRYPCRVRVYCQPGTASLEGFWWRAIVTDISLGGLGLLLRYRFEPETILIIQMPRTPRLPPRDVLARVMHISAGPDNHWVLGCALLEKLDAKELSVA